MNHDLSAKWINDEIVKQISLKLKLTKSYESLNDNSSSYAMGIKKMAEVREKIIEVLYSFR